MVLGVGKKSEISLKTEDFDPWVILSLPLEQGSALQKITNEVQKILPSSQPS